MLSICLKRSATFGRLVVKPVLYRQFPNLSRVLPVRCVATQSSGMRPMYGYAAADAGEEIIPSDKASMHTKFRELAENNLVHPVLIDQITKGFGFEDMTDVQAMTINTTLKGTDVIAQAKTGTGKTMGFLIPVIQRILQSNPALADPPSRKRFNDRGRIDIRGIIVSPTRELAEQIAAEAVKLTSKTSLKVQVAVGGNNKRDMLRRTLNEGCDLLVATPGRLYDLLSDPRSRIAAPNLSAFVMDEADRLLDQGFSQEIEEITRILPDRNEVDRQTLLFSATIPREVMGLVRNTLKKDFEFVRTVKEGELATHDRVPQTLIPVAGLENIMPTLSEIFERELAKSAQGGRPFKAIVYFNQTKLVRYAAELFDFMRSGRSAFHPAEVSAMHAGLTQAQRTRVSERFRRASSAILLSTDVTARGMDFPNVTHVIQVGAPPSREQYIHRIGRTGRANAEGQGCLIATDLETGDIRSKLRNLPLKTESLESAKLDMTQAAELPAEMVDRLERIKNAQKMVDEESRYDAWMSCLTTLAGKGDTEETMAMLDQYATVGLGMKEAPYVDSNFLRKIGMRSSGGRGRFDGGGYGRGGSDFGRGRSEKGGFGRGRFDGGGFGRGRSDGGGFGRGRSDEGFGRGRSEGGSFGRGVFGRSNGRDSGFQRSSDRQERFGQGENAFEFDRSGRNTRQSFSDRI